MAIPPNSAVNNARCDEIEVAAVDYVSIPDDDPFSYEMPAWFVRNMLDKSTANFSA